MHVKKSLFEGTNRVYSAANLPPDDSAQVYPTGSFQVFMPRYAVNGAALAPLSTGRLTFVAVQLNAGETVTSISWMSGSTAGATLTHAWFALYDASRNKLQVTSDDTSASWTASTVKTLSLASTYSVTTTGLYYVGICVVGTTVPTLTGAAGPPAATNSLAPIVVGTSTTGLTTPATAPATAAALTGVVGHPWGYLS